MTSNQIKNEFVDMILDYNKIQSRCLHDFDNPTETYVRIFGEMPRIYNTLNAIDDLQTVINFTEAFDCYCPNRTITYHINSEGDEEEEIDDGDILIFDEDKDGNKGLKTVVVINDCIVQILTQGEYSKYKQYIELDDETPPCEAFWVTRGRDSFISKRIAIDSSEFDVNVHYNDDFDYNKVTNFIEDDKSGLVILYGESGTGKTYLIRQLALTHPDKKFYFMDKTTFAYIMDPSFIDFLECAENSIFVLEDCESLLMDRVSSGNELMSTILNLTDGILGDGMKIKFICTFNASLTNIDKALLRKGRLKYKYEFKKLTSKKTAELAALLNKNIPSNTSLTVCDIYNWDEDNNVKEQGKSIGFGHH